MLLESAEVSATDCLICSWNFVEERKHSRIKSLSPLVSLWCHLLTKLRIVPAYKGEPFPEFIKTKKTVKKHIIIIYLDLHVRWIRKHVSIINLPISKVVMILVIWISRLKSWLTGLNDAEPSSNWILFFFQHVTFRVAKCVLMLTLPILPLRFLKQNELKMRHCVPKFPLLCHPLHIPWASLVAQTVKSPP